LKSLTFDIGFGPNVQKLSIFAILLIS
jgi:hypothetical protein